MEFHISRSIREQEPDLDDLLFSFTGSNVVFANVAASPQVISRIVGMIVTSMQRVCPNRLLAEQHFSLYVVFDQMS